MNASRILELWGWPQGKMEVLCYLYYHPADSYGQIARGITEIIEKRFSKQTVYTHIISARAEKLVDGFDLTVLGRQTVLDRAASFFGRAFFDSSISKSKMTEGESRYGLILLHGAEQKLKRLGLLKDHLKESDLPRIVDLIAKSLGKTASMEL